MANGKDLLRVARQHLGEKYVFGTNVPKDNSAWKGPWDCAEFVSWCVYQVSMKLYGCTDGDSSIPATANAYTGAWRDDARRLGIVVDLERAARTPGAAVLRFPQPNATGHIVLSDGAGGTIEAMGSAYGVCTGRLDGRHWDTGVLVPWLDYDETGTVPAPTPATSLLVLGNRGAAIEALQRELDSLGISPGSIDGIFGPHTQAAVTAFQLSHGLLVDGEVGRETRAALETAVSGTAMVK